MTAGEPDGFRDILCTQGHAIHEGHAATHRKSHNTRSHIQKNHSPDCVFLREFGVLCGFLLIARFLVPVRVSAWMLKEFFRGEPERDLGFRRFGRIGAMHEIGL